MADLFPRASDRDIVPKSPATDEYNCVAWAVWHQRQVIWPDADEQMAWPHSIDRREDVESFVKFFEAVGYKKCNDGAQEAGFEKIVLYRDGDLVTHAARLQKNGKWTSKLGGAIDGEHPAPETIAGKTYGYPFLYMKRVDNGKPVLPEMEPQPFQLIGTSGQGLVRKQNKA